MKFSKKISKILSFFMVMNFIFSVSKVAAMERFLDDVKGVLKTFGGEKPEGAAEQRQEVPKPPPKTSSAERNSNNEDSFTVRTLKSAIGTSEERAAVLKRVVEQIVEDPILLGKISKALQDGIGEGIDEAARHLNQNFDDDQSGASAVKKIGEQGVRSVIEALRDQLNGEAGNDVMNTLGDRAGDIGTKLGNGFKTELGTAADRVEQAGNNLKRDAEGVCSEFKDAVRQFREEMNGLQEDSLRNFKRALIYLGIGTVGIVGAYYGTKIFWNYIKNKLKNSVPGVADRERLLTLYRDHILHDVEHNGQEFVDSVKHSFTDEKVREVAAQTKDLSTSDIERIINSIKTDAHNDSGLVSTQLIDCVVKRAIGKQNTFLKLQALPIK